MDNIIEIITGLTLLVGALTAFFIKIINNYAISLTPEYKDFKTLWDLILNTIPGSNLENNEEIIYFSLPNNELNLKIYISAEIWNYVDELIK